MFTGSIPTMALQTMVNDYSGMQIEQRGFGENGYQDGHGMGRFLGSTLRSGSSDIHYHNHALFIIHHIERSYIMKNRMP